MKIPTVSTFAWLPWPENKPDPKLNQQWYLVLFKVKNELVVGTACYGNPHDYDDPNQDMWHDNNDKGEEIYNNVIAFSPTNLRIKT